MRLISLQSRINFSKVSLVTYNFYKKNDCLYMHRYFWTSSIDFSDEKKLALNSFSLTCRISFNFTFFFQSPCLGFIRLQYNTLSGILNFKEFWIILRSVSQPSRLTITFYISLGIQLEFSWPLGCLLYLSKLDSLRPSSCCGFKREFNWF